MARQDPRRRRTQDDQAGEGRRGRDHQGHQSAARAHRQLEKPDLGRKSDALIEALEGTDSGSDTRAGSLRGGSASGSEIDPDSDTINRALAEEGRAFARRSEDTSEDD